MNPLEQLITLLTFSKCHICQIREGPLCELCVATLAADIESRCYICNKLTKQNRVCSNHTSALRRVWWSGAYKDALKELIAVMKLSRGRAVARGFGMVCAGTIPYLPPSTLVVGVPTAPQRVRIRGFDHAQLMSATLAAHKGIQHARLLKRTSNVDQIGKSRTERAKQMQGVFEVVGSAKDKTILLVDDIITTGATIEAAARRLRNAGATHVDAVVVARHLLK